MEGDGGQVVAASGEVGGDRGQVGVRAHLQHEVHADHDVEQEVAVEQPEAGVVGPEPHDHVAVVGDRDGVLRRRQVTLLQVALQQTSPVQVQSVLQVDFLHVLVGGPADTDHVERVTVQVERMGQVRDLY